MLIPIEFCRYSNHLIFAYSSRLKSMMNHDNQEYLNLNGALNLNMSISTSNKIRNMLAFYNIEGKRIQYKLQVPKHVTGIQCIPTNRVLLTFNSKDEKTGDEKSGQLGIVTFDNCGPRIQSVQNIDQNRLTEILHVKHFNCPSKLLFITSDQVLTIFQEKPIDNVKNQMKHCPTFK